MVSKRRRPKETRLLNRRDWDRKSSLYVWVKHFKEKHYKKCKDGKRYRLAINMKLVWTISDP